MVCFEDLLILWGDAGIVSVVLCAWKTLSSLMWSSSSVSYFQYLLGLFSEVIDVYAEYFVSFFSFLFVCIDASILESSTLALFSLTFFEASFSSSLFVSFLSRFMFVLCAFREGFSPEVGVIGELVMMAFVDSGRRSIFDLVFSQNRG